MRTLVLFTLVALMSACPGEKEEPMKEHQKARFKKLMNKNVDDMNAELKKIQESTKDRGAALKAFEKRQREKAAKKKH